MRQQPAVLKEPSCCALWMAANPRQCTCRQLAAMCTKQPWLCQGLQSIQSHTLSSMVLNLESFSDSRVLRCVRAGNLMPSATNSPLLTPDFFNFMDAKETGRLSQGLPLMDLPPSSRLASLEHALDVSPSHILSETRSDLALLVPAQISMMPYTNRGHVRYTGSARPGVTRHCLLQRDSPRCVMLILAMQGTEAEAAHLLDPWLGSPPWATHRAPGPLHEGMYLPSRADEHHASGLQACDMWLGSAGCTCQQRPRPRRCHMG